MSRAAKPTALRLIEGNREHRPINENEPKPRPLAPECPDWLSDIAREVWVRNAAVLERLGVLTEIDGDMFAAYCDFYSKYVEASQDVELNGGTSIAQSGYEQQRAAVAMAQKYFDKARGIANDFGLTPASRGKLVVNTGGDDSEWEGLLD